MRLRLIGDRRSRRPGIVRAEAGVTINGLVRWTIGRGLAGLEAWAGTPGTRGRRDLRQRALGRARTSAIVVAWVVLVDRAGALAIVPAGEMEFAYDTSRLQRTGEIVVWAEFAVTPGEPDALRATGARLACTTASATQPLDDAERRLHLPESAIRRRSLPPGMPASAGALVDRAGLKGRRHGRRADLRPRTRTSSSTMAAPRPPTSGR